MFNLYIPDAIYERLPLLYLLLALAVGLLPSPLAFAKWLTIGCLVLAATVTRSRRQKSRRRRRPVERPAEDAVYLIES